MTRARALRTFPWVQAVFHPGARPRRVETGVRCRDCRDLRSPDIEAAGARRGLGADEGRWGCSSTRVVALVEGSTSGALGLLGDEGGRGSSAARRRGSLGKLQRRRRGWWCSSRGSTSRPLALVGDEGSSRTMCHLKLCTMYTFSLVRLTGGSPTRVVATARRRRGPLSFPGRSTSTRVLGPLQGTASKLSVIQLGYTARRDRHGARGYSAWR